MDRSTAIAVVTVVFPITFLISSLGWPGVGGGSVLSRALGAKIVKAKLLLPINYDDLPFSIRFVILGFFLVESCCFYGAKGDIMAPATIFLSPVIVSVPFLALSMMGNTIIRAEGQATFAMVSMIIPALVNIALDFVFIKLLDLGLYGAAVATGIPISRLFFLFFGYI
jgi:Na+-driven multidrug efflux pump